MNDGTMGQSRILVADDDKLIARTLSAILSDAGYEVATAFTGEEAVETSARFCPDLLVTDISMGAMNGVEAAVRISAGQPACQILFLSGTSSCDLLKSPPQNLVYSFITKPARIPDLLNAIAYMLPAAGAVIENAAVEIKREAMPLHGLAKTALARLDACRSASSAWGRREHEQISASSGADGTSANSARAEQWQNPRACTRQGDGRAMLLSRAAWTA